MAFSELSVHRALQPWRSAGLNLWLCEDEAHAQSVRQPAARPTAASASASAGISASVSPDSVPRPASPRTPQMPQPAPLPQAPPVSTAPVQDATLAACIRPEGAWPDPWRELLARSPQAVAGRRARIVWSYSALCDDYGGRADPARRAMLQQLLRDLALPSGSHAFWPQTPPPYDAPAIEADPAFFHSGIEALNPLVVVLFGTPAPTLRLPTLVHLVPEMVLGRTFVRVQEVDALAAPFAVGSPRTGHPPHLGLVQFLKSQFSALFIS